MLQQFRSVTRDVTSAHEAKDLYTGNTRLEMMRSLRGGFKAAMEPRGIVVEDTPMKQLVLPATLQASIENKLEAEQAAQKMQFVLDKCAIASPLR